MSKEIIELLEKRYETSVDGFEDKFVYLPVEEAKRILDFLKQPTAGDFTKEARELADLTEENAKEKGLSFEEYTYCLTRKLHEACDIIDIAESITADLLTACEYTKTLLSKGIGQKTHALALLEAAIAKKEG